MRPISDLNLAVAIIKAVSILLPFGNMPSGPVNAFGLILEDLLVRKFSIDNIHGLFV